MSDDRREQQIAAVISAARLVADDDVAQMCGVLVGAIVVLCIAASQNPAASIQVAIDSLGIAQKISAARAEKPNPDPESFS